MIPYIGDFVEDDVVYLMFNTFSSDDPSASCTITNLANTDVHIHKDDDLTQRNNAAGITVSTNFDGITGSHMIKIDTNDDTVAGFWVTGKDYFVRVEGTTIDGATINSVVGHFSIENRFMRGTDSAALAAGVNVTQLDGVDAALDDLSDFATLGYNSASHRCRCDMLMVSGSTAAASNLELDYDGTGYNKVNSTIGTTTANTDMRGTDAAALAATALTNVTWTDAKAGHLDAPISTVDTVVDGIQTDLSNAADGLGALKALIDTIDGVVDTILVDSNDLQTNQGAWATAAGFSTHSAADVKTAIEAGGSSIATILADTNELQTDWVNGGRLDLLIDAILTDTGTTLDSKLDTILGLNQENFYIDNTTYAGTNMTGARVRIYSVAGSVGGAGDVIATYTMTATYTGSEMDTYKVVKS